MDKKKLRRLLVGEFSVKRLLRSVIFIYASIGLYAYYFSDGMIFKPQVSSYEATSEFFKLTSTNGVPISAVSLPNPNATYTILYSHGNSEDLGDVLPALRQIRDMGFAVFAYDYQGYGRSQGKPSADNTYRDINAAYAYVNQQLRVPPAKIIIYGRSVGGGPAVDLARRKPVAGLVLESTFISAFRVVTRIPIFPFDKFPNIDNIKRVYCPVLVIHGTKDEVIPFQQGQQLYAAANEPKRYLWVEEAGHNDVLLVAGKGYGETLGEFASAIKKNY